jgi:hypothetical protein
MRGSDRRDGHGSEALHAMFGGITMADIITLADRVTVSGGGTYLQPLLEPPIDVSAYDQLDLQFIVHNVDQPPGVTFTILTSMTSLKIDDAGVPDLLKNTNSLSTQNWNGVGTTSPMGTSGSPAGKQLWLCMTFPSPGTQLLRYIRYRVDFQALPNPGATTATFSIMGMARRRVA